MLPTPDHRQRDSVKRFITAYMLFGRRAAMFTADFLQSRGIVPDAGEVRVTIHPEFALELGAVLQIVAWERAGFRDYLPESIQTAGAAYLSLLSRIRESPEDYMAGRSGTNLMQKVNTAWIGLFSQEAVLEFGVDVMIRGIANDELMEELADFLWKNRRS